MRVPLTLMIAALCALMLAAVATAMSQNAPTVESPVQVDNAVLIEMNDANGNFVFGDPTPVTMLPAPPSTRAELDPFPSEEHLRVIGKMADGIAKVKLRQGGWWECGIFYDDENDVREKAMLYAYTIVKASYEVSDPVYYKDGWMMNPWGFAGMVWNESSFDRCAFGLHPRMKAYELGLIKRSKLTFSHTEAEVLSAVRSDKMQEHFNKTGFDLGVAQLLSRFYPRPKDYENMLSLHGGTMEGARTMRDHARHYKTTRPWRYWPGYKAEWYDEKVTRWARMLGASKEDI